MKITTFRVDDIGMGMGDVSYGDIINITNMGDSNGTYKVVAWNEVERTIECSEYVEPKEVINKGFKMICNNCGDSKGIEKRAGYYDSEYGEHAIISCPKCDNEEIIK